MLGQPCWKWSVPLFQGRCQQAALEGVVKHRKGLLREAVECSRNVWVSHLVPWASWQCRDQSKVRIDDLRGFFSTWVILWFCKRIHSLQKQEIYWCYSVPTLHWNSRLGERLSTWTGYGNRTQSSWIFIYCFSGTEPFSKISCQVRCSWADAMKLLHQQATSSGSQ